MAYKHYRKNYKKYNYNLSLYNVLKILLYVFLLPFLLVYWSIKFITFLIVKNNKNKKNVTLNYNSEKSCRILEEDKSSTTYDKYDKKESLITSYEKYFYDIFEKNFGDKFKIQTQVNLASVVNKIDSSKYRNELFRNVDFGFFDKETLKPLLLIEINDSTHKIKSRYQRDLKVREILQAAKINLITFYSFYENKEEYIVNKISNLLIDVK